MEAVIVKSKKYMMGHNRIDPFGYSFRWTPDIREARRFRVKEQAGALGDLAGASGGRITRLAQPVKLFQGG